MDRRSNNQVGPPEDPLDKSTRELKQWATDPEVLNQLLGALLGIKGKWPVTTIGQETGQAAKWLEQLGTESGSQGRFPTAGSPERMRRIIEDHGIPARLDGYGNLWALGSYTQGGQSISRWERIDPTIKAIRAWLGY